ncbi:AMP-binding protein [Cellulomonas soli]|uniref:Acetyl-CoA synthetase n=1 Tax=Cellulomonas soli TaxID=931535 RepID=A0A512P8B8_9CELL|nr:AMP-binding protein [Cellulomonas soli]NYI57671.1 acetyl-CoA synthetase [Cellulomonas soli]GEP67449.1 acetyl-CoA synthetase [Cellulomonas soli]
MLGLHTEYLVEELDEGGAPRSFSFTCPDTFNFAYDVVDRLGRETPDRRALRWCNDHGEERTYTFAEISRLSDQAAAYFLQIGVRKGDRVLLVLKRHAQFWWAILGLHKIGAIAVPATDQLKTYDLVFRLTEARISTVVCTLEGGVAEQVDGAQAELGRPLTRIGVRGTREGWADFDAGVAAAPVFVKPTGEDLPVAADPLLLYFTSGTTAQPKMVLHDHSYPVAHIATAKYWHKVDPDGLHLTVSETGWAKSVWGKLYGQWFLETCVDVYDFDRFDPDRLLTHLQDARVTTFCAAPTVYRFLIQQDLSGYDLSALQHCTIAGEAMNPVVYETFRDQTGIELKEGYGQTEMTLAVVTNWWQATKPGSMGLPSPAYDVVLLTEDGTEAGPDEDGEICLRIPEGTRPIGLFTGYADDPATTSSVWHDGYYHTHDLARRDADGYLWYVGRTDDMIKTSGYRVGPFEVESVVMAHPAVRECAVTGAPDPVRGVIVKATVVLTAGYEPSDELAKDIQTFVKARTAPYKYPRKVEFVEAMPTTISGKIRRVQLRETSEG